jgi:hypothetical protein
MFIKGFRIPWSDAFHAYSLRQKQTKNSTRVVIINAYFVTGGGLFERLPDCLTGGL